MSEAKTRYSSEQSKPDQGEILRFHLPALLGQPVTHANSSCAFTQKVRRFATMMADRGHEVIVYCGPEHDVIENVEWVECYPAGAEAPEQITPGTYAKANLKAAAEIVDRAEEGDFLGLMQGLAQQAIAAALPSVTAVEFGIGHNGSYADFRVFESYAWMHTVYAAQAANSDIDGKFFDTVIPAYFDAKDFKYKARKKKQVLYLGRLTDRKGLKVAQDAAVAAKAKLVIAGEGDADIFYGEQVGRVEPAKRKELLADSMALIAPSLYIEPFGCVAVEAMLSGTPAITTDFGAFTETVVHGVTGYRCRTVGEFKWAIENASFLDPAVIRDYAERNFLVEAIAPKYEAYFEQVASVRDGGDGWMDFNGLDEVLRYGLQPPRHVKPPTAKKK